MTVGDLLRRTTSRELTEWAAYHRLQADDDFKKALHAETRNAIALRLAKRKR